MDTAAKAKGFGGEGTAGGGGAANLNGAVAGGGDVAKVNGAESGGGGVAKVNRAETGGVAVAKVNGAETGGSDVAKVNPPGGDNLNPAAGAAFEEAMDGVGADGGEPTESRTAGAGACGRNGGHRRAEGGAEGGGAPLKVKGVTARRVEKAEAGAGVVELNEKVAAVAAAGDEAAKGSMPPPGGEAAEGLRLLGGGGGTKPAAHPGTEGVEGKKDASSAEAAGAAGAGAGGSGGPSLPQSAARNAAGTA